MVQAINNADGTLSLIQMDPNNPQLITLPDGTQAQIRAVNTVRVSKKTNRPLIRLPTRLLTLSLSLPPIHLHQIQQQNGNEATHAVQTLADVATGQEGQETRIAQLGTVNLDLGNGDGTQTVTTLAGKQMLL